MSAMSATTSANCTARATAASSSSSSSSCLLGSLNGHVSQALFGPALPFDAADAPNLASSAHPGVQATAPGLSARLPSISRKLLAEPESHDMKATVPVATLVVKSFRAVMMGPIVFVCRWNATSSNGLESTNIRPDVASVKTTP